MGTIGWIQKKIVGNSVVIIVSTVLSKRHGKKLRLQQETKDGRQWGRVYAPSGQRDRRERGWSKL